MIPSAPFRPARRRLLSQGNLAAKDSLAEHLKQKLRASLKIITLKKKRKKLLQRNRAPHIAKPHTESAPSGRVWLWSIFIGKRLAGLASHHSHLTVFSKMRKCCFPREGSGGAKRVLARSMSALLTGSRLSRRDFPGPLWSQPGLGGGRAPPQGQGPRGVGWWLGSPGYLCHFGLREMPGLARRLGLALHRTTSPDTNIALAAAAGIRAGSGEGRVGEGWSGGGRASERQNSRLHNCSFKCLASRSRP